MKKMMTLLLSVAMIITVITPASMVYAAEPQGIPISTKEDLDNIRNDLDADYYLTNDIVFTEEDFEEGGAFYNDGQGWVPIGGQSWVDNFSGSIDGRGHTISGLKINAIQEKDSSGIEIGLFGVTEGDIRNLNLDMVDISVEAYSGNANIGGIAGISFGTIENCTVSGTIHAAHHQANGLASVGGIVGQASGLDDNEGRVTGCINRASISVSSPHQSWCGGIAGYLVFGGTVDRCCNEGYISAETEEQHGLGVLGGIIGVVGNSKVIDCYNTGEVRFTGDHFLGGIAGGGDAADIKKCYNVGNIVGPDKRGIGGILGTDLAGSTVENCYFYAVDGLKMVGDGEDEFGLSEEEMRDRESYMGFDFTGVWRMDSEGDYQMPYLAYQESLPQVPIHICTVSEIDDVEYTGADIKPDIIISNGNKTLKQGRDYEIYYYDNIDLGTGTVEIIGMGQYKGKKTVSFNIVPININSKDVKLSFYTTVYNGDPHWPSVTIDGWTEGVDFDVSYRNNINAGTGEVIISALGNNATGTKIVNFEITRADISDKDIKIEYDSTEYSGREKKPLVTVRGLTYGEDYTVSYENNIEIGTAKVIVTGKGNYQGTAIKTFLIVDVDEADKIFGGQTRKRIAGANRYQTSTLVADEYIKGLGVDKLDTIIVANGDVYADALSGGYLAKVKQAPILVVNKYNEDTIRNYIQENVGMSGTVYLLGGTAAVSEDFERSLIDAYDVVRLGGADRYETNLKILEEAGVTNEEILICSAMDFADSLSASSSGRPIMLVGKSLSPAQKQYIGGLDSRKFYIIGGEGAVNSNVDNEIKAMSKITERIDGANRYVTSYNVAKEFFPGNHENIVLASGNDFPDGLVGGPLGVMVEGPLLLINDRNTGNAADYVEGSDAYRCLILGGTTLISDNIADRVMG